MNEEELNKTDLNFNEEDLNNPVMEAGKVWLRLGLENFLLVALDSGLSLSTLKWTLIIN